MVKVNQPTTPDELREALREAASAGSRILLGGGFTKDAMGGAVADAGTRISTAGLKRVLAYEPNDLTVSVEAGLPYAELTAMLEREKQMIPLDPPLGEVSTVGGVVAANLSGSRRRLYGTARDLVIGMSYCTLEGDVAETGALVVKSVAGYDIHKLLIGSFGTLAAIASVNFKVSPAPEVMRTFVFSYGTAGQAMEMRGRIASSVLQPAAVDYLNPEAAFRVGLKGHLILVRAAGTERLLARYAAELAGADVYEGAREAAVWEAIGAMGPRWVGEDGGVAVVKLAHGAKAIAEIEAAADGPVWSQALNGVTRVGCRDAGVVRKAFGLGHVGVVEWSDPSRREGFELWPEPGGDFELMKQLKTVFDPKGLLNPGRLNGRI